MIISTYVDDILTKVCKRLGIEIDEYSTENDPTKIPNVEVEWTIPQDLVKDTDKLYGQKLKEHTKKRKSLGNIIDEFQNDEKADFIKLKKKKNEVLVWI